MESGPLQAGSAKSVETSARTSDSQQACPGGIFMAVRLGTLRTFGADFSASTDPPLSAIAAWKVGSAEGAKGHYSAVKSISFCRLLQ